MESMNYTVLPHTYFMSLIHISSSAASYILHEQDIQPALVENMNRFVSFKIGEKQFVEILNILRGPTSLDSFFKAYKTREIKGFLPYE